jgi:hypothetical protein
VPFFVKYMHEFSINPEVMRDAVELLGISDDAQLLYHLAIAYSQLQ